MSHSAEIGLSAQEPETAADAHGQKQMGLLALTFPQHLFCSNSGFPNLDVIGI